MLFAIGEKLAIVSPRVFISEEETVFWFLPNHLRHNGSVEQARNKECFPLVKGPIAQRLEQGTHNPLVAGSNPAGPIL
jgi:hypothetical protein